MVQERLERQPARPPKSWHEGIGWPSTEDGSHQRCHQLALQKESRAHFWSLQRQRIICTYRHYIEQCFFLVSNNPFILPAPEAEVQKAEAIMSSNLPELGLLQRKIPGTHAGLQASG